MKNWQTTLCYIFIAMMSLQIKAQNNYTQFVNTFIGTGGHGHTYPGATLPFGMLQLSPDTRLDGWDGCSGYHYSDSIIYGFSHTHLSGTGIADYCDVLLMPFVDNLQSKTYTNTHYASKFSHTNETATPGFYSVLLADNKIKVELTATQRVGLHKYTFPKNENASIILDLTHRDKLLEGSYIKIISTTKIEGFRRSSSWAKDQYLYFAIEFSQPFSSHLLFDSISIANSSDTLFMSGVQLKSVLHFANENVLLVKCAISPINCEGAWKNMHAELIDWDFEKTKQNANTIWNNELSKIEVKSFRDDLKSISDSTNRYVIFYTALYHTMLSPNIYCDVNGYYRGRDNLIHRTTGFDYYTVFSLWDTFRALHPLLTIIDQKRTSSFINTFLKQYEQGGRLPVWELASNETDCMIGFHAASVIADAAVKDIKGFDISEAYEAMKHSANLDIFGLKFYNEKGFIESNEESESVSKTLEYSYNNWCIAQTGNLLRLEGHENSLYTLKGQNYLNLFDGEFIRPRFNGGWYLPFNPTEVNFNYTEANAWQYNFFFPHDIDNFILNITSKKFFEQKLDTLFTTSNKTTGREQSDITGLIGQYAHGNEPSHHIAYLYDYCDAAYKTQLQVNSICSNFYKNLTNGLIGNEDCGQMSAWYVLSAMGFYPVCPGSKIYAIGSFIFDKTIIQLENGKTCTINAQNVSDENMYIQSATLNNNELNSAQIDHDSIMNGCKLNIVMGDKPNKNWGLYKNTANGFLFAATPIILPNNKSFADSIQVKIVPLNANEKVFLVNIDSANYKHFDNMPANYTVKQSTSISAIATKNNQAFGGIATAHFNKINNKYTVSYLSKYSSQYTGGGNQALVDGMRGGSDFRTGMWQGWWGENMEIVIDLGSEELVNKVTTSFLEDVNSWIWLPKSLEVFVSNDNVHFHSIGKYINTAIASNNDSKIGKDFVIQAGQINTRYIKVIATNYGVNPPWHIGAGGKTWIFCDEIFIE